MKAADALASFDALAELIAAKVEARTAARFQRIEQALAAAAPADKMGTEDAARLCGYGRDDGSINQAAFKMFLSRNPDLPREHAGRKLVFSRAKVEAWLSRKGKRKAGE